MASALVRFFVEPVIAGMRHARTLGHSTCAMIGISGGGWTTTLCSAIDERIAMSFPVAGSLPLSLRGQRELADYENHHPKLYEIANYPELYVLGSFGKARRHVQILNRHDPVGFGGTRGKRYEAQSAGGARQLGRRQFPGLS